MSISLAQRPAASSAGAIAVMNLPASASSDPFTRAAADVQAAADAQSSAIPDPQITALNRVAAQQMAAAQTVAQAGRGPTPLLEIDPVCQEAHSDEPLYLAPPWSWSQQDWMTAGWSSGAAPGLPGPGRSSSPTGGGFARTAAFSAARLGAEAPAVDVDDEAAPVTLVGLSGETAPAVVGPALFGGAGSGVFGAVPTFSQGAPGLDAVQPLQPASNTVTSDPSAPGLAQLDPGALSPAAAIAAPEPATWALMLLGFGGLGALLRRAKAPGALRWTGL